MLGGIAMSQPHETLVAWQRADDLCVAIHTLTRETFPQSERYELSAQLRRAAYSVAANIVEGFASDSRPMRLRYLRISIGSLAEVGYGLHLAGRLTYLSKEQTTTIDELVRRAAAPIHGLIKQLKAGSGYPK
jgi:four helix bundle protein